MIIKEFYLFDFVCSKFTYWFIFNVNDKRSRTFNARFFVLSRNPVIFEFATLKCQTWLVSIGKQWFRVHTQNLTSIPRILRIRRLSPNRANSGNSSFLWFVQHYKWTPFIMWTSQHTYYNNLYSLLDFWLILHELITCQIINYLRFNYSWLMTIRVS